MFRSCQIIIRELCSLLKLYYGMCMTFVKYLSGLFTDAVNHGDFISSVID